MDVKNHISTKKFIEMCLVAAVSTCNLCTDENEYNNGVIESYQKLTNLQSDLNIEVDDMNTNNIHEALDILQSILQTKRVKISEQYEIFRKIINDTDSEDIFFDFFNSLRKKAKYQNLIDANINHTGTTLFEKDIRENLNDMAIIGISARLPKADNLEEFWENLKCGVDCTTEYPESRKFIIEDYFRNEKADMADVKLRKGTYLSDIDKFDYEFFNISPKEASLIDPHQRLFLETAWNALEDSGYSAEGLSGKRVGVYVGHRSYKQFYAELVSKTDPSFSTASFSGNTAAVVPSRVSYHLNLNGPAVMIDTACSSSLVAVHIACQGIRNGDCDIAIVGGVMLNELPLESNQKIGIESHDAITRTFDDDSDGTGEGEGVAAIVLKPLINALKDRDSIYCTIIGSSINQDGKSVGITAPNAAAQEDVIINAWKNANINPLSISYIEAHGTGTKIGDPTEILGIRKAFERFTDKKQFCAIGSVKSNIGHLNNLAGLVGLIKCSLALKHKEIPPSINFNKPNRKISFLKSPVFVNNIMREWESTHKQRRCGVSSFGISGTNCHLVLEEALPNEYPVGDENIGKINILTISAKSRDSLVGILEKYLQYVNKDDISNMRDICYTSQIGRGHYNYRLAIIIKDKNDFKNKIVGITSTTLDTVNKIEGVYFNEIKKVKRTEKVLGEDKASLNKTVNEYLNKFIYDGQVNENYVNQICLLYSKGAEIKWDELYKEEYRMRVRIPMYSFKNTKCWIENSDYTDKFTKFDANNYLYGYVWEEKELDTYSKTHDSKAIVVFGDEGNKYIQIVNKLKEKNYKIIDVNFYKDFLKRNDCSYLINNNYSDYERLFTDIGINNISKIIHFTTLDTENHEIESLQGLDATLKKGVYSLFNIIKSLSKKSNNYNIDIMLISEYALSIMGEECRVKPENYAYYGLGRSINFENPQLKCKCLDLDDNTNIDNIIPEIFIDTDDYLVAYRNGKRYVQILSKMATTNFIRQKINLKRDGVYIITGGLGGISLEICKALANENNLQFAFINRSIFPAREKWNQIKNEGKDKDIIKKIEVIIEIEASGSTIEMCSADVSDFQKMNIMLNEFRRNYGNINGIIHSAGIIDGTIVESESEESFKSQLLAKVYGTWILNYLTLNDDLDFFIMLSSAITLVGGRGVSGYTTANSYLDSFAAYRNTLGKKTLTINWPAWDDTGFSNSIKRDNKKEIFKILSPKIAVNIFRDILNMNLSQAIVGEFNFESTAFELLEYLPLKLSEELQTKIPKRIESRKSNISIVNENSILDIKLKGRDDNKYTISEKLVAQVWSKVLGFKELNIYDDFYELGGDSILAVKLEVFLKELNINFKADELFNYSTIEEIASYIESSTQNKCIEVIENIEPFNELFFKSCFYNSLFPIVQHYKKSIMPFIVNETPVYIYDKNREGVKLGVKYFSNKAMDNLLGEMGIEFETKELTDNVINDIKKSLSIKRPVIIWIDCYYIPFRSDTFLKEHWPHTWLIYGYDDDEETFNIIEHKFRQSLEYEKRTVSYLDTVSAYKGYLDNFHNGEKAISYYEFYPDEAFQEIKSVNDIFASFTENTLASKQEVQLGMKDMVNFIEEFEGIVLNETIFKENSFNLLSAVNDIVNAKKIEMYKILNLKCNNKEVIDLQKMIFENWDSLRAKIAKYAYSGQFKVEASKSLVNTYSQLIQLEKEYYNKLILFVQSV